MSVVQPRVSSQIQQAASWELVTASVLLLVLILVRTAVIRDWIKMGEKPMGSNPFVALFHFIKSAFLGEGVPHLILYLIIFALVFSATVMFFV